MRTANEAAIEQIDLNQQEKSFRTENARAYLLAVFGAVFVVFVFGQIFRLGDSKQISLVSDGIQSAISAASFFLAWRVTKHPSIDAAARRAWRVLTFSYFSYACGHTLWFYYSSFLGIEPFPSLADVGFLGMYPLMFCALLMFPGAESSKNERLKFGLDTAIIMLGGTTLVWHFIIHPTIANIGEDWLTPVLNLSYTVGDMILLLGVTTVLLRNVSQNCRSALLIVVFGILNMFVADLGFAYLTLQGTYYSSRHSSFNTQSGFVSNALNFLRIKTASSS